MDAGTKGFLRGNQVSWDGQHWRTATGDDAERVALRCPRCDVLHQPGEPDACFKGCIEGAEGACCGHGRHAGYVNWPDIGAPATWQQRAFVGD